MHERIPILRHRAAGRLRELRTARGLSQRALAMPLGVNTAQVSRWEAGVSDFSFVQAIVMMEFLQIWTVDLLMPAGSPIPPHRVRVKIATAPDVRRDYGWDDPLDELAAFWNQLRAELKAEHGIDIGDAWLNDWLNIIRERMGIVAPAPARLAVARHARIQKRLIAYHLMSRR